MFRYRVVVFNSTGQAILAAIVEARDKWRAQEVYIERFARPAPAFRMEAYRID